MERMIDYKPQERQDLDELYRKQNVRINELEQENKRLGKELELVRKNTRANVETLDNMY